MDAHDWLAERFEEHRTHLRAVAYRILGSVSDADDAVQEAWLRLARSDSSQVENLDLMCPPAFSSGAIFSRCPQPGRDVVHRVQLACGDGNDKFAGLVISQGQRAPVDTGKGEDRGQGKPPVAVDKRVIPGE